MEIKKLAKVEIVSVLKELPQIKALKEVSENDVLNALQDNNIVRSIQSRTAISNINLDIRRDVLLDMQAVTEITACINISKNNSKLY